MTWQLIYPICAWPLLSASGLQFPTKPTIADVLKQFKLSRCKRRIAMKQQHEYYMHTSCILASSLVNDQNCLCCLCILSDMSLSTITQRAASVISMHIYQHVLVSDHFHLLLHHQAPWNVYMYITNTSLSQPAYWQMISATLPWFSDGFASSIYQQ